MQLAVAGIAARAGLVGTGLITLDTLVAVPTALFVTVYALCTAAAVRLTTGGTRVLAGLACAVVLVILVFSGWGSARGGRGRRAGRAGRTNGRPAPGSDRPHVQSAHLSGRRAAPPGR